VLRIKALVKKRLCAAAVAPVHEEQGLALPPQAVFHVAVGGPQEARAHGQRLGIDGAPAR
jgi:hypothetical protein